MYTCLKYGVSKFPLISVQNCNGDNNISFAEWEPAYGVLSSCACENSEAMFARFDEDNNG